MAILDFVYNGQANVVQQSLETFLALGDGLKLKGPTGYPKNTSEDVPGVLVTSWGLSVSFNAWTANSAVTVLPATIPPLNTNESITRALFPGVKPFQVGDPICVGYSFVLKISFTPK